ncbi:MAG: DUF4124 domain-containing protein [Zoogloea sp.]|jgi:hypothetical protein|nr:DUF4124 domain-containing protein [Zoogloea sp.]
MNKRILLLLATLLCSPLARADVYKCVDEAGHVTYTNTKTSGKGCSTLARDQAVSSVPSGPRPAAVGAPQNGASSGGAGFPRVDTGTQRARDGDRRRILEGELSAEQKSLDAARQELDEQQLSRYANGAAGGERLQSGKDKVQLHERNVEALRREIGNLR